MKIPNRIDILGIMYTIKFENNPKVIGEPDGSVWGYTSYESASIILRKGLKKQQREKTLVHEVMHALLHEMGQFEYCADEELICTLETGIYQVLKDNEL